MWRERYATMSLSPSSYDDSKHTTDSRRSWLLVFYSPIRPKPNCLIRSTDRSSLRSTESNKKLKISFRRWRIALCWIWTFKFCCCLEKCICEWACSLCVCVNMNNVGERARAIGTHKSVRFVYLKRLCECVGWWNAMKMSRMRFETFHCVALGLFNFFFY